MSDCANFIHDQKISVGICSSFRLLISVIGSGFFDSDRKIVGDNVAVLVSFRGNRLMHPVFEIG